MLLKTFPEISLQKGRNPGDSSDFASLVEKRLGARGFNWNQPEEGDSAFLALVLQTEEETRAASKRRVFGRIAFFEKGAQIFTGKSMHSYRADRGSRKAQGRLWAGRRFRKRRRQSRQEASRGLRMKSVCDTPRSGCSDSMTKPAASKMRLSSAPLKNLLLPFASTVK